MTTNNRNKPMRRTMTTILSLYMLLLAVLPCRCAEAHEAHRRAHHAVAAELSAACGDSMSTAADVCSPFCANRCCQHAPVFTLGEAPFEFRLFVYGHSGNVPSYLDSHTCGCYDSVWRPPIVA